MSEALHYIDRYFNGELSPSEKKTFEGRCLNDPAFAKMLAFYITLHDRMQQEWAERKKQEFSHLKALDISENDAELHLKGKLTSDGNYQIGKGKVITVDTWKRLAVAAVVLGVIALGITMYVQSSQDPAVAMNDKKAGSIKSTASSNKPSTPTNTSTVPNIVVDNSDKEAGKKEEETANKKKLNKKEQQQLFKRHFTPDAPPKESQMVLEEAFEHYKSGQYQEANGDYEEVLAVVESLAARSPEDKEAKEEKEQIVFYAHYYNALSYLAEGKTSSAIRELKAIKVSPDKYWQSKQQWYMALAYLQKGEGEKAEALLKQVSENKHAKEYRQKAIKLVNELNVNQKIEE